MALFDSLVNTADDNATAALYALLKKIGAKVTKAAVRESLELHPEFPSLLSLSDVLTDWRIDNTALQLNTVEQLRELPLPFIAHTHKNNGWYVLVTALQGDTITYTDTSDGRRTKSLTDFEKTWSGVVLLAEADEQAGEADYTTRHKEEVLNELRRPFILGSVVLIFLAITWNVGKGFIGTDWLLLITKTIGLTLCALLVAKQLGSKNALTDRLCRINDKTSCDTVLNSPAAKLWGWLSWTDVGLLYFAGGLLSVLLIGTQPPVRPLLNGLALLALPYTLFSVYYQARVLRQWCPLCLGVQVILVLEGIIASTRTDGLPGSSTPYQLTLVAFVLPTIAWIALKPLFTHLLKSRWEHQELAGLKRDPDLFRASLMQQPKMPPVTDDMHPILLGNPDAEYTVTMVTNPYCRPCSRAHKELEELLSRNSNVQARITFAWDGETGRATQVAKHLIALTLQGNAVKALADWYDQPNKDYTIWAEQYPVAREKIDLEAIINKHNNWCQVAHITATPTLFLNGHQLPEWYRLNNLRWLVDYLFVQPSVMDLAKSK